MCRGCLLLAGLAGNNHIECVVYSDRIADEDGVVRADFCCDGCCFGLDILRGLAGIGCGTCSGILRGRYYGRSGGCFLFRFFFGENFFDEFFALCFQVFEFFLEAGLVARAAFARVAAFGAVDLRVEFLEFVVKRAFAFERWGGFEPVDKSLPQGLFFFGGALAGAECTKNDGRGKDL